MIYTNIKSSCIRHIDICGNLTFENERRHPSRTLPYHDLVYIKKGGFNVIVENELIESREGDIMFLPAYKHHYGSADNLEDTACYYIHFTSCENDYLEFQKGPINDEFFCIPSKIDIKDNSQLIAYFHEIITLSSINIKEQGKLINSILSRLCAEIDLLVHNKNKYKYSEITNEVISILNENIDKKITMDDLAKHLKFSSRNIQKHFKNDTRRTIHEYHLQLKLNKSKYYLTAYPKMSIKEISGELGFYDEFHYSKVFKKVFGLSPKQYRKK